MCHRRGFGECVSFSVQVRHFLMLPGHAISPFSYLWFASRHSVALIWVLSSMSPSMEMGLCQWNHPSPMCNRLHCQWRFLHFP